MRIWCKCINRIQPKKRIHNSPFSNLDNSNYSYSQVYLGAKGIVHIYPQNLVLSMSYSAKDGIFVNIKKNRPYHVLFDYVDGAYYINDDRYEEYEHLAKLLFTLKNEISSHHHTEVYENLEATMFDFITNHYSF